MEQKFEEFSQGIQAVVKESIQVRLAWFSFILDEVAVCGELTHWKVVDMSLIALAATLEEKGMAGLVDKSTPPQVS